MPPPPREDSNPGSHDCESGILPLNNRAPVRVVSEERERKRTSMVRCASARLALSVCFGICCNGGRIATPPPMFLLGLSLPLLSSIYNSKPQALRHNVMNIDEPAATSRKSGKSTYFNMAQIGERIKYR